MTKYLFSASLQAILLALLLQPVQAQEKLVLGYTNLQSAKIPVPLGKEAGLFAKHGLELELIRVTPGHTAVPKLLSGEIQLFLGNGDPVVKAIVAEKARLSIIASLGEDTFNLVARSSIRTVGELRGKRVGVSNPGSSADRIARLALRKLGLDPERDVQMVATGLNESRARLELVLKGELDATIVNTENVMALGERKAAVVLLAELEELGIFVSGSDISVNRDFVQSNRPTLKRFLAALIEAIAKSKEDLDLSRRMYRRHATTSDPHALEWRVREFLPKRLPAIPFPNRRALEAYLAEAGEKDPAKIESVADFTLLREVANAR
jgi:NitT/TauT family transport system substrate-binding protein